MCCLAKEEEEDRRRRRPTTRRSYPSTRAPEFGGALRPTRSADGGRPRRRVILARAAHRSRLVAGNARAAARSPPRPAPAAHASPEVLERLAPSRRASGISTTPTRPASPICPADASAAVGGDGRPPGPVPLCRRSSTTSRRARSAVTQLRESTSSMRCSVAVVAASSARHTTAMMPCAAPGNMSSSDIGWISARDSASRSSLGLGQYQGVYFTSIERSQVSRRRYLGYSRLARPAVAPEVAPAAASTPTSAAGAGW